MSRANEAEELIGEVRNRVLDLAKAETALAPDTADIRRLWRSVHALEEILEDLADADDPRDGLPLKRSS